MIEKYARDRPRASTVWKVPGLASKLLSAGSIRLVIAIRLGSSEAAEQELPNERNMRNLCHGKQSSDPSKNSGNNQAENAK